MRRVFFLKLRLIQTTIPLNVVKQEVSISSEAGNRLTLESVRQGGLA